jgi:hypothetical protein
MNWELSGRKWYLVYFKVLAQHLLGRIEDSERFHNFFFLDHNTNMGSI